MATDTCTECGFDAADYTHDDLLGTLRAQSHIWRAMTRDTAPSVLTARPRPDSLSVLEHAVTSCEATRIAAAALDGALALDAQAQSDLAAVVNGIEENAARIKRLQTR